MQHAASIAVQHCQVNMFYQECGQVKRESQRPSQIIYLPWHTERKWSWWQKKGQMRLYNWIWHQTEQNISFVLSNTSTVSYSLFDILFIFHGLVHYNHMLYNQHNTMRTKSCNCSVATSIKADVLAICWSLQACMPQQIHPKSYCMPVPAVPQPPIVDVPMGSDLDLEVKVTEI